jgi:hypothetical protein
LAVRQHARPGRFFLPPFFVCVKRRSPPPHPLTSDNTNKVDT